MRKILLSAGIGAAGLAAFAGSASANVDGTCVVPDNVLQVNFHNFVSPGTVNRVIDVVQDGSPYLSVPVSFERPGTLWTSPALPVGVHTYKITVVEPTGKRTDLSPVQCGTEEVPPVTTPPVITVTPPVVVPPPPHKVHRTPVGRVTAVKTMPARTRPWTPYLVRVTVRNPMNRPVAVTLLDVLPRGVQGHKKDHSWGATRLGRKVRLGPHGKYIQTWEVRNTSFLIYKNFCNTVAAFPVNGSRVTAKACSYDPPVLR